MKKIFALLLALSLCFSMLALVSCTDETPTNQGSETPDVNPDETPDETPDENKDIVANPGDLETLAGMTPEQLYNAAMAETAALTNFTATSEQIIYMPMVIEGFGTIEIRMFQTIEQKFVGALEQTQVMKSKTEFFNTDTNAWEDMGEGVNISQSICITGGNAYVYVPAQGLKFKAPITEADLEKLLPEGSSVTESGVVALPSEFFEGTGFVDNGDGTYSIIVTMSAAKYTEYFGEYTTNLGMDLEITEVVHDIKFNSEGKLINMETDLAMSMAMDGVTTNARAVAVTIFENVGTTVVLPPEDANTYPEGSLNI